MNISSTNSASLAGIPLSLQSTRPRGSEDRSVAPVERRNQTQEYLVPDAPKNEQRTDLDDKTEKKLGRIKEVQVAFMAALNIANSIEEQYLLEPII
jgi:hypothetical protein